jgi:PAS domain S-box-containing protein
MHGSQLPIGMETPAGRSRGMAYALAVATTVAAVALRLAVGYDVSQTPTLTLFALPIALSALYGGAGPGLLATGVAAVATNFYLLPPRHTFSIGAGFDSAEWVGLIALGVLLSVLSQALHRSRARAYAGRRWTAVTLASIGDAVITADPDGHVMFLNREAERLTGFDRRQALGRPVAEVFDAVDAETGRPSTTATEPGSWHRARLRSRAGAEIPIEQNEAPIHDAEARALGTVIVIRDRTSLDAAEAVREGAVLDRQLARLAHSAPGVLCAIRMSTDGTVSVTSASPGADRLIGLSAEALVQDGGFFSLVEPDDAESVRRSLARSAESLTRWSCEFGIASARTGTRWVQGSAMPEREADGSTLWYGFLSDTTERRRDELALRERAALVDLSSDAVFVHEAVTAELTLWSAGAEQLYGYSAAEALGRSPHELLATEWPESAEAVERSLQRTGRWQGELRHRRRDGGELIVLSRQALQRDAAGEPRAVLEINTDITPRKLRESELAAAEARWTAVAENLPGASLVIFNESLRYVEARGQALHTLGLSTDDLLGHRAGTRVDSDELAPLLAAYRAAIDGRQSELQVQAAGRSLDARIVPLDVGDGRRRGMGLFVDVTDRERAERERRASEQRFRGLVEAAPDPIFGIAADGRIIFVSPRVRDVLGYEPSELVGQPIETLVPERFRGMHGRHRAGYLAAPSTRPMGAGRELFARRKDGTEVPVEISLGVTAEQSDGLATAVLVDISARHTLESQLRQAQKLEAIGQLAGGIAHDFNNLLLVISGHCAEARDLLGNQPGAEELKEVDGAVQRASQLTAQLLAFARRQVLEVHDVDLNDIVTGVTPMIGRLIGEDIEIIVLTGDDLPAIRADRGQLEQILVNLAVNARDAMPTGGTLTVETRCATLDERYASGHVDVEPGRYVCLTVTDTGEGIDPDVAAHLFEPFYTTKEVGRGTGLGLATVHGIVTQSGGQIRVYSEPGLGASFKLYFPAHATTAASTAAPAEPDTLKLTGSETVLLCEDEASVRHVVERILTRNGYSVLTGTTPHEAIQLARTHGDAIDVLITDVIMPGVSGPDLATRLHESLPHLRVLFMSGYTAEAIRDRATLPLGSAMLEKPFDGPTLLRSLRALLDQQLATPG